MYIPEGRLRVEATSAYHDTLAAGHFGRRKTLELISRDLWWPNMATFINQFVDSCDTCGRAKNSKHKPFGLLQPLPTPTKRWSAISMDFITDLPASRESTCILVVVDRLTKMAHFVACPSLSTAEELASLFWRNIFRLHGLPDDIVSDRGSQFVSRFWKRFLELLGIKSSLSTAFHLQSDGQTERVNQILDQYLRCFSSYQQDNWSDLLPSAEFAYNNATQDSTKMSPFFANYGYHPRSKILIPTTTKVPRAEERIEDLDAINAALREELDRAKERYKRYADRKRVAPPTFSVGDKVWLSHRNISSARSSPKLEYRKLDPFTIAQKLSPLVFRLNLPPAMKIHPVFHVSLLERYIVNSIPGRTQPPPPPVIISNEAEYIVHDILDAKLVRGRLHYLVDWEGYSPAERSWEPTSNIHANQLIRDFH